MKGKRNNLIPCLMVITGTLLIVWAILWWVCR